MKQLHAILATAALSLCALTAQADLVSGHRYTIRPYTQLSKFFCISSADDWKSSNSETRKNCVVYTDTPTEANGGVWVLTTTDNTKWNIRPVNTTTYSSGHWLNPRTGNNIGNDTSSTGNSAWTITAVSGETDVYTLNNSQPRYMVYEDGQTHPRWATSQNSNIELNYFVLVDLDAEVPVDPPADYSSHLPQLTTDTAHPVWYTMKSAKYGSHAQVVGTTSYMGLTDAVSENCRFYFTGTAGKDSNGFTYYSKFIIHTEYAGLEGKGLDGRNKWASPGREYEAAGVKYGDYEGVTIYRGTTNNILAWSDTNSLQNGNHVDYSDDSSDKSNEARVWIFEPCGEPASIAGYDSESNKWYGTYYADYDWALANAGESVSIAVVDDVTDGSLSLSTLTGVVPAGTGVMLCAEGLSEKKTVYIKKATGTYTPATVDTNYLRGTATDQTVIAADGEMLYKLAYKDNRHDKLGFYWGVENGTQLDNKAYKAYLAVPAAISSAARGFDFVSEGTLTGLHSTAAPLPDCPVFTLQGQRTSGALLPAGIYTKGGRKFIVK